MSDIINPGIVLFCVDSIHHISWNATAFEDLVLPEDLKDVVLTLVQRHEAARSKDTSMVAGKGMVVHWKQLLTIINRLSGNGLAFLLGGPPRTGKTLTVEAGEISLWNTT